MKKETNVVWSESWLSNSVDIDQINDIFQQVVYDFVEENDIIINVEVKTSDSELSRFWLYLIKK